MKASTKKLRLPMEWTLWKFDPASIFYLVQVLSGQNAIASDEFSKALKRRAGKGKAKVVEIPNRKFIDKKVKVVDYYCAITMSSCPPRNFQITRGLLKYSYKTQAKQATISRIWTAVYFV